MTLKMFQLHVVLDQPKDWLQYVPPWVAVVASLLTVFVAFKIAQNQNRLQKTLAKSQIKIQKMQLEQQERQLKKNLFDRRFEICVRTRDFAQYVLGRADSLELTDPPYSRMLLPVLPLEDHCPDRGNNRPKDIDNEELSD